MNIYKVLPDLGNERQMKLWHKALRVQWSAEDLDWNRPLGVRARHLKEKLARVLTPVLMGEQSALYSVSAQIPTLGHHSEVPAQFYLTTWAVDEARHTELFARFYDRLGLEPLSIRKFPAGYIFQSQITAKDTAEWLSGVLVSEVLAKLIMEEFVRVDMDPVLSDIAHGILEDEARHLAFNHLYMEQRFYEVYEKSLEEGREAASFLRGKLEHVLGYAEPLLEAIGPELDEMDIDWRKMLASARAETTERLERSIDRGSRVADGSRAVPTGATKGV